MGAEKSGGEERVAPLPVNAPCSGPRRQNDPSVGDPGLPLTTGGGSGLDKTPAELLAEMRAFALTLPDDLGPLFGRDGARMCDEWGRLREQLDAAREELQDTIEGVTEQATLKLAALDRAEAA